jgi:hypothetical protein
MLMNRQGSAQGKFIMEPHDLGSTRIWWDGSEVSFVRWTDKALVFSWGNVTETAVHMPRGAVVRLMQKGVLQIQGETPEWIELSPLEIEHVPEPDIVQTPAPQVEVKPEPQNPRLSIVARLIRKLGGSTERNVSRVPS